MKYYELKQKQSLPLDIKINMSKKRIREWYEYWGGKVYIGFSGGKDSTVLLHLVRNIYPDIPAVFVDTGLEYPEIKEFVSSKENVIVLKPEMSFIKVIEKYGFPVVSKKVARMVRTLRNPTDKNKKSRKLYWEGITQYGEKTGNYKLSLKWRKLVKAPFKISEQCCDVMKKKPFKKYEKETNRKAFTGVMACNSKFRQQIYLRLGCNNFKGSQISNPMAFWNEKDIWDYIKKFNLDYCSVYDTGVTNTGCIYCMFGVHLEKQPNRFQLMKKTHTQLYNYCITKLGLGKVLDFIGVEYI